MPPISLIKSVQSVAIFFFALLRGTRNKIPNQNSSPSCPAYEKAPRKSKGPGYTYYFSAYFN